MLFKLRFLILTIVSLGIGFGLLVFPNTTTSQTIAEEILEYSGQNSAKSIDFTFEILGPEKITRVDRFTLFKFRLTNLPTSDEVLDKDGIDYIGILFEPHLKDEYVDKYNFLFRKRKISLEPGESYTGFFFYFNWSSQVPVGYVQQGDMYITINGQEQRQPYEVTIIP